MKQTLFILLSLIILQNTSFAIEKEDLITFHPPQTEAEEALDVVLRFNNNLYPVCKNNESKSIICPKCKVEEGVIGLNCPDYSYISFVTQDFLSDIDRQNEKYQKESNCDPKLDPCSAYDSDIFNGANDSLTDIGFLYYTIRIKDDITYIYMLPQGFKDYPNRYHNGRTKFSKEEVYTTIFSNYAMKKENGKWQLDGLCHSSIAVNHKYCWSFFRPTFY